MWHEEKKILEKLDELICIEKQIYHLLNKPTRLLIHWKKPGEKHTMSTNNVSLNLTAPFGSNQAVPVELLSDGVTVFPFNPANIQWSVQNAAIATFNTNTDGSSVWTPLSVGSTGVAVQDTATGLSAQGTLTVTGTTTGQPTSMSIQWEVPPTTVAAATAKHLAEKKK
jgi:hypothetical protein